MRGEANKKERKEQRDIQKEDHENHRIPRTKMKAFSKGRATERSKSRWQSKSDRTRTWFPFLTACRSSLLRSVSFWGDGNYRLYHVPAVPPHAQRTHSWLTCRYPSCSILRTRSDNAHSVQSFCFCALKILDLQMWFEYSFFFFFYLLSPRKGKARLRCPFPETTSPDWNPQKAWDHGLWQCSLNLHEEDGMKSQHLPRSTPARAEGQSLGRRGK